MKLSNAARQLLAQLCMSKDAYLFGVRDADTPFKLNFGSDSLSVSRQAVDELSIAGCLNCTTTGAGTLVFVSFTVSDEGRSRFRTPKLDRHKRKVNRRFPEMKRILDQPWKYTSTRPSG
jgi:hypothetical protein